MVPQCSSRQGASPDMQHDLLHTVTLTWRDLRSNFKIDLSRIKDIWIDPALREEHDGVKLVPLA